MRYFFEFPSPVHCQEIFHHQPVILEDFINLKKTGEKHSLNLQNLKVARKIQCSFFIHRPLAVAVWVNSLLYLVVLCHIIILFVFQAAFKFKTRILQLQRKISFWSIETVLFAKQTQMGNFYCHFKLIQHNSTLYRECLSLNLCVI